MSDQKNDQKQSGGLRRRAREMALQLLFQSEFAAKHEASDDSLSAESASVLKRFCEDFNVGPDVADYGRTLFLGIQGRKAAIDAVIQGQSAHWKTSRMGLVDLSVMRIAVFEMKFLEPQLSPNVAINEAVDLAKEFGSTESGAFVNGILDQIRRSIDTIE